MELEANEMHARGYDLVTVVTVDKSLVAFYKLVREPETTTGGDMLGLDEFGNA